MKTVQTEVPEQLYVQLRSLVALGWFQDEGDVIREALRRFLGGQPKAAINRHLKTGN